MKKSDAYRNYFYAFSSVVIVAVLVVIVLPSWVFQKAIDNAFTFINGMTTSVSIIVTFGGVINTLMFHEMTKDDPKVKSEYFEALGFFLIPLVEAWVSHIALATGFVEWGVKLDIIAFLTALLIIVGFYILISRKLKTRK